MRDSLHVDHDAAFRRDRASRRQSRRRVGAIAAGLALFLAAGCARPSPHHAAPTSAFGRLVAIVTWNLHGEAGDLQSLVADLRAGTLTDGIPPQEYLVLLQEASEASRVGELHWFFAPARRVDGVERGNAILSSLPLADARTIALPRERQPRVAALATVRVGGVDLTVVNVHLENRASWWKGALPGDAARARQMNALLAHVPDGPGILAGDLNVWLGTREPAFRAAMARYPDGSARDARPTFRERLALDHLFFRLPPRWKAVHRRVARRYGSDHYPVIGMLATR